VVPGAGGTISPAEVDAAADAIRGAKVFVTQLEQSADAALRGLEIARHAGVTTIFNPAPAVPFNEAVYPLCDYITPNESEAAALTGVPVEDLEGARRAAEIFLAKGVRTALITLGENGALFHDGSQSLHIPAFDAGRSWKQQGPEMLSMAASRRRWRGRRPGWRSALRVRRGRPVGDALRNCAVHAPVDEVDRLLTDKPATEVSAGPIQRAKLIGLRNRRIAIRGSPCLISRSSTATSISATRSALIIPG
jgi:hypothetical protein